MFGTDTNPRRDAYRIYYRFLETDDEYFDCSASHHLQGFWRIYGIYLPKEVLEKVYRTNAERLLGIKSEKSEQTRPANNELHVRPTGDFAVTGDGAAKAWKNAVWQPLAARGVKGPAHDSKFKLLYSKTGIYVLFQGSDSKLTATMKDGEHLWIEDVFEVFLQPNVKEPSYFEYEISPLGSELSLMVTHRDGKLLRWRPWVFEEGSARATRRATSAAGGEKKSNAAISGWTAEVFIPYSLLEPLMNLTPKAGDRWGANFYRMDHDDGHAMGWSWAPVGKSFHEFQRFGTLVFE